MPPVDEGGAHAAMSAPLTFGIGAKAKHTDCAAFFLDWVATNEEARKINVAVGGSNPGGPPDLPIPAVDTRLGDRGHAGRRPDVWPRTTAPWTSSPTPPAPSLPPAGRRNCRRWSGGQQDAAGLLKAVQKEYETELSR